MPNRSEGEEDGSGWIDVRRPLTAVTSVTGGLAGGDKRRRRGRKSKSRRSLLDTLDWSDWVTPRRAPFVSPYVKGDPYAPHPRFGNLIGRHARPAMVNGSGGVAGVSPTYSTPMMMEEMSVDGRFLHRQPPLIQGVVGGMDREKTESEADNQSEAAVESEIDLGSGMSPLPPLPFKVSTEAWDACLAEAEQSLKKYSFYW